MRTVVLIPFRSDGGRRDQLLAWVTARWQLVHPDFEVFVGSHDDGGPFNRSAALNVAAAEAGDWDLAVLADGDSFVGGEQVADIRRAYAAGEATQKELAARYGLSQPGISKIIRRETYSLS